MRKDFYIKRQKRAETARKLQKKNDQEAKNRFNNAQSMADAIPMGQPILVGHHSENRHRKHIAKIDTNMCKGVEAQEKAKFYANKAENAEKLDKIFSDDPKAIEKLRAKLEMQQKLHGQMKDINKFYKKYGHFNGLSVNDSLLEIAQINVTDSFCQGVPFPSFSISNSGANIRKTKFRLEGLEKAAREHTTEKTVNNVHVVDNVEDNRLQLFFPEKPCEEIRRMLRQNGFKFSYRIEAWQRHRGNQANWKAEKILKIYGECC